MHKLNNNYAISKEYIFITEMSAEDQRIDAIVASEIMHNPQEPTCRGVGAIWRQIEQDGREQQALYGTITPNA